MATTNNDAITITIILAAVAAAGKDFGATLLIADEAAGTSLDGDRVRTYQTLAAVTADNTAGFVSASILAAATDAFGQAVPPNSIKIGRKTAIEAYDVALAAIEAVDPDFYAVAIESRATADQVLVGTAVEASAIKHLFFLQSAEADILTAGFPAGLTALDGNERSIGCYHDIATEWFDFIYPVNRLAFDVDTKSVSFALFDLANLLPLAAVTASTFTDTEKLNARTNKFNLALAFGTTSTAPFRGVNFNARNISEMVTRDWFEDRLNVLVQAFVLTEGNAGRKIPVTIEGQVALGNLVSQQFGIGVTAGHFVTGQTKVEFPLITAADRAAEKIRVTGEAQFAIPGKEFDFVFNFGPDPLE